MDYYIKDLSRTLVIDKFSEKAPSLCQALKDAVDEDGDFDFNDLKIEELTVKSFDEFRKKFIPVIYQVLVKGKDGDYFKYVTDNEKYPDAVPASLDSLDIYEAAMRIYSRKGVEGTDNKKFDYSDFSDLLNPKKIANKLKNTRGQLQSYALKFLEAKENNNSAEADKYFLKMMKVNEEIETSFKRNPIANLTLSLADLQIKLGIEDNKDKNPDSPPKTEEVYRLSISDDGEIQKVKINTNVVNNAGIDSRLMLVDNAQKTARLLLEEKIKGTEDAPGFVSESEYMQNLVLDTYTISTPAIKPEDREKYFKAYDTTKKYYKAAQDSLLKSVNTLIEKILDVKAMFDNAGREFEVIIANNTAKELMDEKVSGLFVEFLENTNFNDNRFINFAIIPQLYDSEIVKITESPVEKVELEVESSQENNNQDDFIDADYEDLDENGDVISKSEESESNDKEAASDVSSVDYLKNLLKSQKERMSKISVKDMSDYSRLSDAIGILIPLSKYKCMSFIGYKGCDETGFSRMKLKLLEKYQDRMNKIKNNSHIEGKYVVFSYPNFTLMSGAQAGNIEICSGEFVDNPGFYIDAPYVALGLTVKSLNSDFLGGRILGNDRYNINVKDLPRPCVRFDFEDPANDYKNRYTVISNMNSEIPDKFNKKVADRLEEEPFGFCFYSVGNYKNKAVTNSYVKFARNLCSDIDKDNRIFATLVTDYTFRDAKGSENRLSYKKLKSYLRDKNWSHKIDENYFNNPFQQGDEIIDDGIRKISFKFKGTDKETYMDNIDADE